MEAVVVESPRGEDGEPRPTPRSRSLRHVSRVRVLIVDDCNVMDLGFRMLLTSQPWVERCVVASDVASAGELARRYDPHVVILDPALTDGSGATAATVVRAAAPQARLVVLTAGTISVAMAKGYGASALLPRRARLDHVTRVVHHVAAGGDHFRRDEVRVCGLSPRECDVLALLADGATNLEIAERLHLSRDTVKQHAAAIYRKLGVRNRTEAARRANELGISARAGWASERAVA